MQFRTIDSTFCQLVDEPLAEAHDLLRSVINKALDGTGCCDFETVLDNSSRECGIRRKIGQLNHIGNALEPRKQERRERGSRRRA